MKKEKKVSKDNVRKKSTKKEPKKVKQNNKSYIKKTTKRIKKEPLNKATNYKMMVLSCLFLVSFILAGTMMSLTNDGFRESLILALEQKTKQIVIDNEPIGFKSIEEDDNAMYVGSSAIKQKGENGNKKIVYEMIYDANGEEVSRTVVKEGITKDPVNEIIGVGTKVYARNVVKSATASNVNNVTTKPKAQIKQYTDSELISMCNNAIIKKYGWAMSKGDAGSDDKGPRVAARGNGIYQVSGWRRIDVWSFVQGGCTIKDGVVTKTY